VSEIMIEIVVGIALLAMINFAFKATGPALLMDRQPSAAVQDLIASMSPALLAGLVVVQLAGPRWTNFDWTALPGLAAAAIAYTKGLPDLVCILLAVAVTVLLRLAAGV
jgi:branched-subunit amino acid transport protein AzlD